MKQIDVDNIVFDLGAVVFNQDRTKCTREFAEFFSFITAPQMPKIWHDYDLGNVSFEEVIVGLCDYNRCERPKAERLIKEAISKQEEIAPTAKLIVELKRAGYKLYVLSNMSHEFIEFLHTRPIYKLFDGETISCNEHIAKPDRGIFERLISRYRLDAGRTLFIDDRVENAAAARMCRMQAFEFDRNNPAESCNKLHDMLL